MRPVSYTRGFLICGYLLYCTYGLPYQNHIVKHLPRFETSSKRLEARSNIQFFGHAGVILLNNAWIVCFFPTLCLKTLKRGELVSMRVTFFCKKGGAQQDDYSLQEVLSVFILKTSITAVFQVFQTEKWKNSSLHKTWSITAHFRFITAQIGHHCTLN